PRMDFEPAKAAFSTPSHPRNHGIPFARLTPFCTAVNYRVLDGKAGLRALIGDVPGAVTERGVWTPQPGDEAKAVWQSGLRNPGLWAPRTAGLENQRKHGQLQPRAAAPAGSRVL